ncbi:MFS transporter [Halomonas sp. ZH2S]|uniref:MFS transporter n=1 Tax=Vreelandella zhuhanensis TaxID=2684210 RepID=A0A7X3KQY8_9GAMM|nr:MFS transporter [Halomonas zhuhanensis]MWJ28995.1 MFS transporter [Halomonas zhuhanensis]
MIPAKEALVAEVSNGYRSLVVVVLSPLAFALVFACWTIFAVLGIELQDALGFGDVAFAVLLAVPMLTGALASLPMARLAERKGGGRVMVGCLLLICPFLWWIGHAVDYREFVAAGAGLGLGAGSLAAGLVYVARWCPRQRVGLALGLYGAGMLGAGLSYLLLPLISEAYGWRMAPKLYLLPVLVVAVLLWLFADHDADAIDKLRPSSSRKTYSLAITSLFGRQVWRLALIYSYFFGAFVALTLWLPGYLAAQYQLPLKTAALWALLFPLSGGVGQILGGMLADWRDFRTLRWWLSACVLGCLFLLSYPSFEMRVEGVHGEVMVHISTSLSVFVGLLVVMGMAMGIGKGSLMRLIHRDHANEMALVGGLAVTLGSLFAAVVPLMFVLGNEWIGIRTAGFMFLYGALAVCMLLMLWDHANPSASLSS